MGKDASNAEPGRSAGEGQQFSVPRPADVPGSTPPPARRSVPPPEGGDPADRPRPSSASIHRASMPRVSSPPRPAGPAKSGGKSTSGPAPKPTDDDDSRPAASSAVALTPMRIIGVGIAGAPPPLPQASDFPTPLEVPIARRSVPTAPTTPAIEDEDEDEEAVPLRRLSTPPPPTDEPAAVVAVPADTGAAAEILPPLGAPPPPPRGPGSEAAPATRPSAGTPVPARERADAEVEVELAPASDRELESLDEADLTEVPSLDPKGKQRRLPPPPPLRSSFAETDDGKRKPWWEEFFQEDFGLSTPEPSPAALGQELEFIQRMLAVERGAQVLDVGCGNGQHAIALAQAGYSVMGLDVSTAMLTRAGSRARAASQPVEFVLQDMREMNFDQRFDAVLCWNATFGYFERERNHAVLRAIHQALKPGGHFLLDIPNRDFIIDQEPSQNWFECEGCVCMDDMRLDYITSRLMVKRTIMLDDGRNKECYYTMRVFSLHELGRLMHEIGFRVLQVSGAVNTPGVFLGSTSPRLIVLVTKP